MAERAHAFVRLEADIRNNRIPHVVLLHGQESFLVDWARDRLLSVYLEEAVRAMDLTVFEEQTFSVAEIHAACETVPLVSPRRVVLLEEPAPLWKQGARSVSEEARAFAGYLEDLPQTLLLIIVSHEDEEARREKGRTALYKAVEENGTVYEFTPLAQPDLVKFVQKRFRAVGKDVPGSLIRRLIAQSGYLDKDVDYTLYHLENDIRKILFHAGDSDVTEEDIELCLSATLEQGVFQLLDAIAANRKGEALHRLHDLLRGGDHPMRIGALLVGQLEIMLMGAEMRSEGAGLTETAKALKVNEYRLKKAMQAAGHYDEKTLRRILYEALCIEGEIKTGHMSDEMALEMFIAGI